MFKEKEALQVVYTESNVFIMFVSTQKINQQTKQDRGAE